MEPYRSYFRNVDLVLPETEVLTQKILQLPTGTSVSENDIHGICQLIRFSIANAQPVIEKISNRKGRS